MDLRGWAPRLTNYDNGDFSEAILDGVNFGSRSFQNADFSGASLIGAEIGLRSDWSGVVFRDADLTDLEVIQRHNNDDPALFVDADFRGANFTESCWHSALGSRGNTLDGALMDGVDLSVARCFSGISMKGTNLPGADLSEIHLSYVDLSGANLVGADLSDVRVSTNGLALVNGANMRNANLRGASLGGWNFREADLSGADLTGAYLSGANFIGANLQDTTFGNNNCGWGVFWDPDLDFPPVCP